MRATGAWTGAARTRAWPTHDRAKSLIFFAVFSSSTLIAASAHSILNGTPSRSKIAAVPERVWRGVRIFLPVSEIYCLDANTYRGSAIIVSTMSGSSKLRN
jgi:hypothetical protein